ncbi:hypothetical protein ETU09_08160 [Apibacter muscae]|uniref:Uncharacterized protein n=1 Tax=Apibacter muscae TaxID=2509004 RepID=A0A563DBD2_9FLAO|nr:hypothetical protein [Apibacter muscae]TWP27084.1 hypothetical protein ETU09_08160 [Apibacter muscae]
MTREELIHIGKQKVRNNESLLLAYIDLFEKQFGYKPNCMSCSFNSDWDLFVKSTKNNNSSYLKMKNNKYKINRLLSQKIFTYIKDRRTYRIYGNQMTDEFAENYLKYGTEQELEDRKKEFETLVETEKPEEDSNEKEISTKKTKVEDKKVEDLNLDSITVNKIKKEVENKEEKVSKKKTEEDIK